MDLKNLALEIAKKDMDVDYYADKVLQDAGLREDIVNLTLTDANIMVYYHGYYILDKASRERPGLFYEKWEDFRKLLSHGNSYHRDIGLTIIANLTAVDGENYFGRIFEEYFSRLYDEKYMTGCCCVRNIRKIIAHRKEYTGRIIGKLLEHKNRSRYTEKQEALLESEILDIFDAVHESCPEKDEINSFIMKARDSISPKTRRKAKELVKKYAIGCFY